MSAIRSRGNRTTEWRLRAALVSRGVSGFQVHVSGILGRPDFIFPAEQVAIFVDGCFWHGCPRCFRMPRTSRRFWQEKITRNQARDRRVRARLRREGWSVVSVWEHTLGEPGVAVRRIQQVLARRAA